jgi:hypothetical protein
MGCSEPVADDTNDYCTDPFWAATATATIPPETADCVGCHDAPAVRVHAELNANAAGAEACAVCHGPGAAFDVAATHLP